MADEKKKVEVVDEPPAKGPINKPPVEEQFRNLLAELIFSVAGGDMKLSDARRSLHSFIDELPPQDKETLYITAGPISQRVRDIATSLTTETPSLLVKMQP